MIQISTSAGQLQGLTRVILRKSIREVSGSLFFCIAPVLKVSIEDFGLKAGERIEVSVNGIKRFVGIVEQIETELRNGYFLHRIGARDLTGLLAVDNQIGEILSIETPASFKTIFNTVAPEIPFTDEIGVSDLLQSEAPVARPGESTYRFLEPLARIRSALLCSSDEGGFLLTREGLGGTFTTTISVGEFIKLVRSENASFQYDRFLVYSQSNDSLGGVSEPNNTGEVITSGGSRNRVFIEDNSLTKNEAQARAEFERDLADQRIEELCLTMIGHDHRGEDFVRNQIYTLSDPIGLGVDIAGNHVCHTIEYCLSDTEAETTKLYLQRVI